LLHTIQSDAPGFVKFASKLILKTGWMHQRYNVNETEAMIGAAIPFRQVWPIGYTISGCILFNVENYQIVGL
tara:strand:+ start:320 stop:535 length:216 start_codon:yes stop_codon:yes gene_type:complete